MQSTVYLPKLRKFGLFLIVLMTAAVLILSVVELWVISSTEDVPGSGYGFVQADSNGMPAADNRGAFLILNEQHNAKYPGNLVELLATTEPGVVSTITGAHVLPTELKSILVQSAIVGEPGDYRVYRIAEDQQDEMKVTRQPGGKDIIIEPANGVWKPGSYLVDVPSDGMFGGRTYYQFYVDTQ